MEKRKVPIERKTQKVIFQTWQLFFRDDLFQIFTSCWQTQVTDMTFSTASLSWRWRGANILPRNPLTIGGFPRGRQQSEPVSWSSACNANIWTQWTPTVPHRFSLAGESPVISSASNNWELAIYRFECFYQR